MVSTDGDGSFWALEDVEFADMRPIKFRCWDKEEKKMYRFDGMLYCSEYNHLAWELNEKDRDPDGGSYCNLPGMDSFEVMQFTGCLDRTGKEIYEGDIVRHIYENDVAKSIEHVGVVEWVLSGLYSHYPVSKPTSICAVVEIDFGNGSRYSWEVIGNVWENAELLKKTGK